MGTDPRIRKLVTVVEVAPESGLRRIAAIAVVANPLAGLYEEDLTVLHSLGRGVADRLVALVGAVASREAILAAGKGAAVGQDGELEHAAALIGPGFDAGCRDLLPPVDLVQPATRTQLKPGGALEVALRPRAGASAGNVGPIWRLSTDGHPGDDEAVVALVVVVPAS